MAPYPLSIDAAQALQRNGLLLMKKNDNYNEFARTDFLSGVLVGILLTLFVLVMCGVLHLPWLQ